MDDELIKMLTKIMEGQEGLKLDISQMKLDISQVKLDISQIGAKIDGELIPNQQALLDGYKQNYEAIADIKAELQFIRQDTEGLKDSMNEMKEDINYIAGKTIKNDSKINKLAQELKAVK